MSLSLLFPEKSQAKFMGLKEIPLDASVSESHVYQALVTTNPVEQGSDITDNVSINPIVLTMTGFITDTPVKIFQGIQQLLSSTSGSGTISKSAHNDLVFLFEKKQPFTVVTGLKTYSNMILRRLSFPRSADTGQSIRFEAELIQVTFASFQTETLDSDALGNQLNSKDQAQSKKDLGKQPGGVGTAAENEKSSLLYNTLQTFGVVG